MKWQIVTNSEDYALIYGREKMISIGTVLNGPELSGCPVDRVIHAAMKAAVELRGDFEFGSALAVNVVFFVPGSLGSLDWDGLRESKYSRKKQLLLIQVAVPLEAIESDRPEDFVIESLYGANAVAFEFFRQKRIEFPLAEAEMLVSQIEACVQSN